MCVCFNVSMHVFTLCVVIYMSFISKLPPTFVCTCLSVCVFVYILLTGSVDSVALAARGFGVVPARPSGQPGGDGVRGGLLGHAVVADHCVETAPRVGILGRVVGLKRGGDTPLVL